MPPANDIQRGGSDGSLALVVAEALLCQLGAVVVAAAAAWLQRQRNGGSNGGGATARRRWPRQLGCGSVAALQ
jgi:hypothetical protein